MVQSPEPIQRVNLLFNTSLMAHESIFEMRRELIGAMRSTAKVTNLLTESAEITLRRLPSLTLDARRLADRWHEQSVLDPEAGEATLRELTTELDNIHPETTLVQERQREGASELRAMLDE